MPTRDEMLFRAEASVRYHRRRAAFLEQLDLFLTLVLLAAGGGTFITVASDVEGYAASAGLVVTAIGLVQLVYKPEACASRHRLWLKQWSAILAEARSTREPASELVADWVRRQHEIETECVHELSALKCDCFNRTTRALDREAEPYRIRWYQRALIQLVGFDAAMEKEGERIRQEEDRRTAGG